MNTPPRFPFRNSNGLTLRLCLIFVFLFLPQTSQGDSMKQNWLDVLEQAVQRHDGKLWISNQLSIVVDSKGDGSFMHPAEKEKELVYTDALKKMFSLLKAVIDRFEGNQDLGIEGEWPKAQRLLKSRDPLFSH